MQRRSGAHLRVSALPMGLGHQRKPGNITCLGRLRNFLERLVDAYADLNDYCR